MEEIEQKTTERAWNNYWMITIPIGVVLIIVIALFSNLGPDGRPADFYKLLYFPAIGLLAHGVMDLARILILPVSPDKIELQKKYQKNAIRFVFIALPIVILTAILLMLLNI